MYALSELLLATLLGTVPLAQVAIRESKHCVPPKGGLDLVRHFIHRWPKEVVLVLLPGVLLLHSFGVGGLHQLRTSDPNLKESRDGGLEEDDVGWKNIYGDVMRPPRGALLLGLAVAYGAGQWATLLGAPELLRGVLASFVLGRLSSFLRLSSWTPTTLPLLFVEEWPFLRRSVAPCTELLRCAAVGVVGFGFGRRCPPLESTGFFQGYHRLAREIPSTTTVWTSGVPLVFASFLLLAFLGRQGATTPRLCRALSTVLCCELSLLTTYQRLQQENHRWHWWCFNVAFLGALSFQVTLSMEDQDLTWLQIVSSALLAGSTAFLVNLRMLLFAYSHCVCDFP
ncbi:unnamed protein product [Durusdinium trenchii]|uniref:Uncharacterized protein n=1 Tax=Durusdinium trenchii TaxID=1381693 RepID=A0ABP0MHA9_9DINO